MADLGKVIKGLECCSDLNSDCDECPYNYVGEMGENGCLRQKLIPDALDLLKEQEAVEPEHNLSSITNWFCGNCGRSISRFHDYCPSCGKKVKWE